MTWNTDLDQRKPVSIGKLLVKEDAGLKNVAEECGTKCTSAIIAAPNLDILSASYPPVISTELGELN